MATACGSLRWTLAAATAVWLAGSAAPGQSPRRVTRLAEGVYAIEHQDEGDGFASGNTTVIIGDRQVFVVDAGFLPSAAREDIGQIRRWTGKPVAFLLNTHFHNDHNFGNRTYLDAYPSLTIIAQEETRKDMDRFGPGSASRVERGNASLQRMLDSGQTAGGHRLTADETAEVKRAVARGTGALAELRASSFQSATLTFRDGLTVDLGNREVQVRFLGRGNTAGDAIVYLPAERIVVAGDLIVHPIPYFYDGYPAEWAATLERLGALDATTIVPGHGPVLHDKTQLYLIRDLLTSAVTQLNAELARVGPAMFRRVEDVRDAVDLSSFRQRFVGSDTALAGPFDDMVSQLVTVAFKEASLR